MGQEIEISAADGGRFTGYLALPRTVPIPGLIVLPKVYNTNPHIRSAADGYADDGFVVITPDIYRRQESGSHIPCTLSLPLSMSLSHTSFTARDEGARAGLVSRIGSGAQGVSSADVSDVQKSALIVQFFSLLDTQRPL